MSNIIGSATVGLKQDGGVVEITCDIHQLVNPDEIIYKFVHEEDEVGYVEFKYIFAKNADLTRKKLYSGDKVKIALQSDKYLFYGPVKDDKILDKVYIVWINNNNSDKYKGVGKALIQAVFEESMRKGCEGRLDLNAAEGFEFYYPQGFRAIHDEVNEQLEEEFMQAKSEGHRMKLLPLSSVQMYLPEEAIASWKAKAVAKPFLLSD